MASIAEAIDRFRGRSFRSEHASRNGLNLRSKVEPAAGFDEVRDAWRNHSMPPEVRELWAAAREARLFEDVDFGQWGLVLLSPTASAARTKTERAERPSDFKPDDVVIGEFLGDQDLLVLAPSEADQRRLLIALPLDNRSDWYGAGHGLADFLDKYFASAGDKYWER
jgi:hypothetical protein